MSRHKRALRKETEEPTLASGLKRYKQFVDGEAIPKDKQPPFIADSSIDFTVVEKVPRILSLYLIDKALSHLISVDCPVFGRICNCNCISPRLPNL